MNKQYKCPCCGEVVFEELGEFEICPICDWQDDPLQRNDPDDNMGVNTKSLNEAKTAWKEKKTKTA